MVDRLVILVTFLSEAVVICYRRLPCFLVDSWMHAAVLQSNIYFVNFRTYLCFYSKMGRISKTKRSKNDQNMMTSAPNSFKNRPGDLLEALWRPLGCPRGPKLNVGSEKLVRWTAPGPPDRVHFSILFQCNIHLIFCFDFSMHF